MIIQNNKGQLTQDTGYVATAPHQYEEFFKYVPLYVAELTKLNKTVSVSGNKLVVIQVKNFNDLMSKILQPNTPIPESQQLINLSQSEVYNGVNKLQKLYNKGIREFVLYTINPSAVTIPFDNKTGDYRVIVYSPVGKTGYGLTGKC
jgi:hypothetical protein